MNTIAGVFNPAGISNSGIADQIFQFMRHRYLSSVGSYTDDCLAVRLGSPVLTEDVPSTENCKTDEIIIGDQLSPELIATCPNAESCIQYASDFTTRAFERNDIMSLGHWQSPLLFYQPKERNLFIIRDLFGRFPIYYAFRNGDLVFASEVQALYKALKMPVNYDKDGLAQSFIYWSPLGKRTVFENIFKIPEASFLKVSGGAVCLNRYWHIHDLSRSERTDNKNLIAEVRPQIQASVSHLLETQNDSKMAVYISGGLDSAIIFHELKEASQLPLHTYSLSFDHGSLNETGFQNLVLSDFEGQKTFLKIDDMALRTAFLELMLQMETPLTKPGPFPLALLAKRVMQDGLKYVWTGEGSDELFYGYDMYKEARLRAILLSDQSRQEKMAAISDCYQAQHVDDSFINYLIGHLGLNDPLFALRMRFEESKRILQFLNNPPSVEEIQIWESDLARELELEAYPSLDDQTQVLLLNRLLPDYLLTQQAERALAPQKLIGMMPFLDLDLLRFSLSIPADQKLWGFNEKAILKDAYTNCLPERVITRRKHQFTAPGSNIFRSSEGLNSIKEWLSQGSIQNCACFDPMKLEAFFSSQMNAQRYSQKDAINDYLFIFFLSSIILHSKAGKLWN